MDTGNKTLAQLSEEGKEARYVTLEVASKLSGYTKEYLERLCASHKVHFLIWNNDQRVLELESLLKETHTILLSYEGIDFVDKAALTLPADDAFLVDSQGSEEDSDQDTLAHPLVSPIPHFVENGRLSSSRESHAGMFSFTGRAVVSDSQHPGGTKEEETHVPISVLHEGELDQHTWMLSSDNAPVVVKQIPEIVTAVPPPHSSFHIPIMQSRESYAMSQDEGKSAAIPIISTSLTSLPDDIASVDKSDNFPTNDVSIPTPTPVLSLQEEEKTISVRAEAPLDGPRENIFPAKRFSQVLQPTHPALPSLRSVPQTPMIDHKNLPARPPEHHLTVIEHHPLMKSVGFNAAFALLFLLPSVALVGSVFTKEHGVRLGGDVNIAAVGVLNEIPAEPNVGVSVPSAPSAQEEQLEFSDEVVVTEGQDPRSVLVQPIFKDGAGAVHEYTNARIGNGTTSDIQ
jgi:hypothetical protein